VVPIVIPVPAPQPSPAAVNDGGSCYADEFVQICVTKSVVSKKQTPLLTFVAKNLTQEALFLSANKNGFLSADGLWFNSTTTDDEGNICNDRMVGLELIETQYSFQISKENAFNRVSAGKSINIHTSWNCETKATGKLVLGNTLDSRLYLVRLTDGKMVPFVATLQDIAWKKSP
jgi:hypothetical protein